MKYICRLFANDPNARCSNIYGGYNNCRHSKPHEWIEETIDLSSAEYCFNRGISIETECDCVPVGLEYYMKEIIKKEETKNDR
jgi:hypothetical protein